MPNKKLPNLNRAKPKVKPLGAPKKDQRVDAVPDTSTRTPMLVNPRMRGTRRPVRTNFSGGPWNGTPEVE